jgi:alanine racemase
LKPVLTWKTAVVHVKGIVPGYGELRPELYGGGTAHYRTLPVGYGDGYKRCISNKAEVLIHGKRAPHRGNGVYGSMHGGRYGDRRRETGDEVVLIGCQGDECIAQMKWRNGGYYQLRNIALHQRPRAAHIRWTDQEA